MKVHVDQARCQGHTLCAGVAPDVFLLRETDGHAYVEIDVVPPELEDAVVAAAANCPEQAIVVEE